MGLAQLNYQNSNPRSNKNLEYSYVQILAIVSTHTFHHQVKCPQNTDENSFKHFIGHTWRVWEKSLNFSLNKVG